MFTDRMRSATSARTRLFGLLPLCCSLLLGCGDNKAELAAARHREAIRHVFELDAALGKPRDVAMATKDLAVIIAGIRQYASAVSALDFSALPEDVRAAYIKHVDAWRAAADLFDHYSGMRGTLRAAIDGEAYAKQRIEQAQKAVEQSWNEVKSKAKAYGVDAPD